jgi:hypothetical protein
MKPLTFDELKKALENGEQVGWHPEYNHQLWKDGRGPLTLIHASFLMEVQFKDQNKEKHYFVGYRCSDENCDRCSSSHEANEIGPHHILMKRNGYSLYSKMEWIEYKKRTEIKEHKNPVFVKL